MSTVSDRGPLIAWGVAGVPLVVTLVQTLMALFGYTSESAGVEPVADPLLSVPVLFEAAVVFKSSSGVVMALFLLIVAAWAAQGAGMYLFEHREATYGAVGLGAVLFAALFFGVYAPLYTAGVPALQLVGFTLVPVLAAGAMVYAAYDYPWERVVEQEANADLATVEADLEETERTFDTEFDRRFPASALDTLADVAPDAVRDLRAERSDFESEATDLHDRIETCRSLSDSEERYRRVAEVETAVDRLDASRRLDRAEGTFRDRLADRLADRYDDRTVTSTFGGVYRLENLPTEHREFDLPGVDGPVHVNHLGETLTDAARGDTEVGTLAEAVAAAGEAFDRLESYLDRREQPVATAVEDATDHLSTAESRLEDDRLRFAERLREVVVDGQTEAATGSRELRRQIEEVKRTLNDCQFDEARRDAERVAEAADTLAVAVEFATTLSSTVDSGGSLSVPAELSTELVETVATAAERGAGDVRLSVADGRVEVTRLDEPDTDADADATADDDTADDTTTATGGDSVESAVPTDEVVDEVLYVLRELETAADDDDVLQYNLEDLPEVVAVPDVLVNVRRFVRRQSDLFSRVDLQSPEPPGWLELTAADDTTVAAAVDTATERFRDQYT